MHSQYAGLALMYIKEMTEAVMMTKKHMWMIRMRMANKHNDLENDDDEEEMMMDGSPQHRVSKVPVKKPFQIRDFSFFKTLVHSMYFVHLLVPELVVKTLLIFCAGDWGFGILTAGSPGDF